MFGVHVLCKKNASDKTNSFNITILNKFNRLEHLFCPLTPTNTRWRSAEAWQQAGDLNQVCRSTVTSTTCRRRVPWGTRVGNPLTSKSSCILLKGWQLQRYCPTRESQTFRIMSVMFCSDMNTFDGLQTVKRCLTSGFSHDVFVSFAAWEQTGARPHRDESRI